MGSPYQLSVARSWNQSLWAETFGQSSNVGDKWWKDLRLNSQCQMPLTQTPFVLVTQSFRLSIRTSAKEVSRCMAVGDFNVNRRHVLLVLFSFFFFPCSYVKLFGMNLLGIDVKCFCIGTVSLHAVRERSQHHSPKLIRKKRGPDSRERESRV